jgi:hypothetical protein
MKKTVILWAAVVIGSAGICSAESTDIEISMDITYMSKFMDHGDEYFGEQGGFEESFEMLLPGSGFGISAAYRHATGSGYVDNRRSSYSIFYENTFFEKKWYKTDYRISWIYNNLSDLPRNSDNTQEWEGHFSWENLIPGGLIPFYTIYYEYPAGSGYDNRNMAGFIHAFGFDYSINIEDLQNPLNVSAEMEYRDGLGGDDFDHDFSHITLGASNAFEITGDLTFTPGIYYQISMDKSVNNENVIYTALNMHYEF